MPGPGHLWRLACLIAAVLAISPGSSSGQGSPAAALDRLGMLVGSWEGTTEGQPGKGTVRRTYSWALNRRFIRVQNRSEYPAQEKNPKGEVHEDEGFFSFDRGRKRIVFRQFHVEGFVNQYVEDEGTSSDRWVFTSEAIENIPPGWRARETYIVHGPNELEEIFELAQEGKPFQVYSRSRLKRVE